MSSTAFLRVTCALIAVAVAIPAGTDTIFVSSFSGGQIYAVDPATGTVTTIVSGLSLPEDGACSPTTGKIYFAESNFDRVTRWNQDGSGATDIIPAAGAVAGPEGMSFDTAGNLYFNTRERVGSTAGAWLVPGGDPANPATQVVPPFTFFGEGSDIVLAGPHTGALLLVARGEQKVVISEPPGAAPVDFIPASAFPIDVDLFGVTVNGCGEVFVSFGPAAGSGSPSEVYRFDPNGNFVESYASGFARAGFLEFDSVGDLYVADNNGSTLFRVTPDKTMTPVANIASVLGVAICRTRPVPVCTTITCDAGGPYSAECAGERTCFTLDGTGSGELAGNPITYAWSSSCPGATFDDPTLATPQLCVDTAAAACRVDCVASLTVSNGAVQASCEAPVTIEDTLAPTLRCALLPVAPSSPASPASPASMPSSVGFAPAGGADTSDSFWDDLVGMLRAALPRPARLASSACSGASSGTFQVLCEAEDVCDAEPVIEAKIRVTQTDPASCAKTTTEVEVACGELLEIELLAPPCPAKPPKSPRPPVVVGSGGIKVVAGQEVRLHVEAKDACGHAADACEATASLCAPGAPKCAKSACP